LIPDLTESLTRNSIICIVSILLSVALLTGCGGEANRSGAQTIKIAGYLVSVDETSRNDLAVVVRTSQSVAVLCRVARESSERLTYFAEGDAISVEGEMAANDNERLELANCKVF
jgi:hypothetical protein